MQHQTATAAAAAVRGRGGEWWFASDKATGNTYFYNRRTRETRWTLPPEFEQDNSDAPRIASSLSEAHVLLKKHYKPSSINAEHIREAIDPASNKKYFYDSKTKQSFWEDPRLAPYTQMSSPVQEAERPALSPQRQLNFEDEESPSLVTRPSSQQQHRRALFDEDMEPSPKTPLKASALYKFGATPPDLQSKELLEEEEEALVVERSPPRPKPAIAKAAFNKDHLRLIKRRIDELIAPQQQQPQPSPQPQPTHVQQEPKPSTTVKLNELRAAKRDQQQQQQQTSPVISVSLPSKPPPTKPAVVAVVQRGARNHAGPCLRKSGCTCAACMPLDEDMTTGNALGSNQEELVPCASCSRKFSAKSLVVHQRVCAKVFKPAAAATTPSPKKPPQAAAGPPTAATTSKWRKQSEELRAAMQRGRGEPVTSSSVQAEDVTTAAAAGPVDDGLIVCPHCERRFNDKAAERHIPRCADIVSKPKTLRRGKGAMAASAIKAMPPPAQAAAAAAPPLASANKRSALPSCPNCRRNFSSKMLLDKHLDTCFAGMATPKPWARKPLAHTPATVAHSPSSQSSWDDYS